ncbi:MAG: glutaredoxin family protein [Rhodocyclales bacterium]|nr:glutaredoxin family protein [Rhodocyclales bacterium]
MKPSNLLIVLMALFAMSGAHAETYRWTDKSGRVMISDLPPGGQAQDVRKAVPVGEAATGDYSFAARKAAESYPVTLYTGQNCGQSCDQALELLRKRNIPFTEKRIQSAEELAEFKKQYGDDIPLLKVGNQRFQGYQASTYEQMLDLANYPKANPLAKPTASPPSSGAKEGK